MSGIDFLSVTELAGDEVSYEQVLRLGNRYYWAGKYCQDKDVLEVACGTGQGLGYLSGLARSINAGDYSEEILQIARKHYGNRIVLKRFDALEMPYPDKSLDVVIIFEALYYIPSAEKFIAECMRVLREGGMVLIATANKDLYDFNPSPFSYQYHGVVELGEIFESQGFSVEFFGSTPVDTLLLRQRILRPVKKLAVKYNLIPKTMSGKKFLKSLVYGRLVQMPPEIKADTVPVEEPTRIPSGVPDRRHKVIYCAATLNK